MKLLGYNNFIKPIYENLDFLLEAKMVFTDGFKNILGEVDNPLSKKILDLEEKDVEKVDANYIDIFDQNFINFKSDKKVEAKTGILNFEISYINNNFERIQFLENSVQWSYQVARFLSDDFYSDEYSSLSEKKVLLKYQKISKEDFVNILEEGGKDISSSSVKDNIKKSIISNIPKYYNGGYIYRLETMDGKEHYYAHSFDEYPILITNESKVKPQKLRVGSFAQTLLKASGVEVDNKDLEDFVTKFGLKFRESEENLFKDFKLVEGEDIRKFYDESNYYKSNASGHTLGSSCMRYSRCQSYLNIYVKNPKQVQLLVLLLEENPNKIIGRALLWKSAKYECTLDDGVSVEQDTPFMDRIYVNNSKDEELFKQYARKMGYVYKKHQNSSGEEFMFGGSDTSIERIDVYLSMGGFTKFPYVDTICYYDPNNKVLSNIDDGDDSQWTLNETDGTTDQGCQTCDGDAEIECRNCRGEGSIECSNCDGNGTIVCEDCEGNGTIDGEECSGCGGDGTFECDDCNGNGNNECSQCEGGGLIDCPTCNS
jgi:hypothetical protein